MSSSLGCLHAASTRYGTLADDLSPSHNGLHQDAISRKHGEFMNNGGVPERVLRSRHQASGDPS